VKAYPIGLIRLEKKKIVVVGGGKVASRKVEGLLRAGATVSVISPEFCEDIRREDPGLVKLIEREYRPGDLEEAFLVIAATDQPQVNQAVWQEAELRGCLVNVVDDPQHCTFILPAVIQRGDLSIAVHTGGASPALASRLRANLEEIIGPEYGILTDILAELRPVLMQRYPAGEPRRMAATRLVDSDLLDIIRAQGREAAFQVALSRLESEAS